MTTISEPEIESKLKDLKDWHCDGLAITKSVKFKNFADSLAYVTKVGQAVANTNHHPDIKFGWDYAKITFTTHDAGGLTHKDFDSAKLVDSI